MAKTAEDETIPTDPRRFIAQIPKFVKQGRIPIVQEFTVTCDGRPQGVSTTYLIIPPFEVKQEKIVDGRVTFVSIEGSICLHNTESGRYYQCLSCPIPTQKVLEEVEIELAQAQGKKRRSLLNFW